MGAGQVAVALLEAKQVAVGLAGGLEHADLLANVLEAGEGAAHLKAVFVRQGVEHGGRYDCGDGHFGAQVLAVCRGALGQLIGEQHAHFVAGDEHVVAVVVHGDAHAVGVGVGCQQQVGLEFLG